MQLLYQMALLGRKWKYGFQTWLLLLFVWGNPVTSPSWSNLQSVKLTEKYKISDQRLLGKLGGIFRRKIWYKSNRHAIWVLKVISGDRLQIYSVVLSLSLAHSLSRSCCMQSSSCFRLSLWQEDKGGKSPPPFSLTVCLYFLSSSDWACDSFGAGGHGQAGWVGEESVKPTGGALTLTWRVTNALCVTWNYGKLSNYVKKRKFVNKEIKVSMRTWCGENEYGWRAVRFATGFDLMEGISTFL